MTTSCPIGKIFLIYPSRLLKKIIFILSSLLEQITLLGKFLILGKLYLSIKTFIVAIFPISNFLRSVIFDLSVIS